MKKFRILAAILAAAILCVGAVGFAACGDNGGDDNGGGGGTIVGGGNDDGGTTPSTTTYQYDITMWVGEGTDTITAQMINDFNSSTDTSVNPGFKFNATIEIQSESTAAGNATSKPADCADIYCIAQDQLARCVNSQVCQSLNSTSTSFVESTMSSTAVDAAKVGNVLYAFPMTLDNAYFLYYDTSVISEQDVGSLNAILTDCKNANKNFSMNLTSNGAWYDMSFFLGTGCYSNWTTNENGQFTGYEDNITSGSSAAYAALKGIQLVTNSGCYSSSAEASELTAGTPSAALVSGIWSYNAAKTNLGDNFGVAVLPEFTVANQTYQMKTYLGSKMMCVKPQDDTYKALGLQYLARYLTSAECQMTRFNEVGWGPSNTSAAEQATGSAALDVLNKEIEQGITVAQGQFPTNWWSVMALLAGSAKDDTTFTDANYNVMLTTYQNSLNALVNATS
ncbi:MAG: extracellular solute-binding protein [Clostridia bacterium]|nr:extracellular solute-binding protein [Clostridia bacterium]